MFRKATFAIGGILMLVSVSCSAPTASPGAAPAATPTSSESRTAALADLKNTVQSRQTDSADWQAASEGELLKVGGGVKTGEDSRARVNISDGTIVRLAAQSEFGLAGLSPAVADPVTKFTLVVGKVWIAVAKALGGGSFEVETPVGSASVRGSFMSVQFGATRGQMIASCLEGKCRLTAVSGKFTDLNAGEQSGIPAYGADPSPAKPIDIVQIQQWGAEFPEASQYVATITPGPEPTATPMDTPTPGAGGAVGGGQTACDHPYFPIRAGATWTYSTSQGSMTWTVDSVSGDTTSAVAVVIADFGSGQVTYHWQCDANGLTSYDFATFSASGIGQIATSEVLNTSGVWLPAAGLLAPGYSWSSSFQRKITLTIEGGGGDVEGTSDSSRSSTVTSADPVSVGGQTYDGLQISGSETITIQMQAQGISVPATTSTNTSSMVLARDVGIVSSTSTGEGGTDTNTLTSFNIP